MEDTKESLLDELFYCSQKFDTIILDDEIIKSDDKLNNLAVNISNLIGELYQAVGNKD